MKKFAKYTLVTDMKLSDVDKALGDKINAENEANTGVWSDRYGLVALGGVEENGVDYVAFLGQVNGHTKGECNELIKGLKAQIKESFPKVSKVNENFVAFGERIF